MHTPDVMGQNDKNNNKKNFPLLWLLAGFSIKYDRFVYCTRYNIHVYTYIIYYIIDILYTI